MRTAIVILISLLSTSFAKHAFSIYEFTHSRSGLVLEVPLNSGRYGPYVSIREASRSALDLNLDFSHLSQYGAPHRAWAGWSDDGSVAAILFCLVEGSHYWMKSFATRPRQILPSPPQFQEATADLMESLRQKIAAHSRKATKPFPAAATEFCQSWQPKPPSIQDGKGHHRFRFAR